MRSNISHAKRISQIPQGIYFVEKGLCFVSKHRSFSGGEGEIPSQPYATPSGAPRLFRCGLLRGATQTVRKDCLAYALRISSEQKETTTEMVVVLFGGEGEIRTLERFYPLHDFQSCALDQLSDFSVLLTSRSIALDYYITANPQCQHKNSIVLLNNFAFSGIYF